MALTPNYGFIIPTGSDAVNLLTQCYPNFSSLDTILKPIQESGVTVATDTKVGTVHQLVRTDSSCNMFRFIATGNYASGDTFTVDGASVTATAMDGTALSAGAFVINQSVVCILNNLVLTVLVSGKETTSLPASAVTYDNTVSGLTATNAQDALDELHDSANIAYDNTVSGLTATNVQSAIDEIVLSGSNNHGVYELWKNPAQTSDFVAQTITLSTDKTYDSLILELGYASAGEYHSNSTLIIESTETALASVIDMVSNHLVKSVRQIISVATTNSISITVGNCTRVELVTYGSTPTSTTANNVLIINRIFGIVHNT